ncbi:MAG: HAD family hydrolase [Thermoplasmata archaeon]|nr:HAD family hydrolase [Thermoplasmata archaeon]
MAAVTFDLWHTLVYLSPEEEEHYMADQVELGTSALGEAKRLDSAAPKEENALREAFERAYAGAIEAASNGRSVSPAAQFAAAAVDCSRDTDPTRYLTELRALVEWTPFRAAPGAVELLEGLLASGYRLAVISNTVGEPGAFLLPLLERMGIRRLVEKFVFSDELPWAKPAPEIFLHALAQLDSTPEAAVHVGDGQADLDGARRAGYRGAILYTGLDAYGPKYRKLFASSPPEEAGPTLTVATLAEAGTRIRELLPPGGELQRT